MPNHNSYNAGYLSFKRRTKLDWHDQMLAVCGIVFFFAVIFHSLQQSDQIEKLTKDLRACEVYQEFVVDQM